MFQKFQISKVWRWLIISVLISGLFSIQPAEAKESISETNLLNADGTLKLDGKAASFQPTGWDVQLDPTRGPLFSPSQQESTSPLTIANLGEWAAISSNPAGTDGAISSNAPLLTEVNSFVVVGTDIYIGGCFQNAGGEPTADYLAKWDTLTGNWSGIGNDGSATPNGALKSCIRALAVDGENIYVGGYPTLWVNGAPVSQAVYAAKWNGTSWSSLGPSFDDQVTSFAIAGNNVYVGGYFTGYLRKWDGVSWSIPGGSSALNSAVDDLQFINSDLYVGGNFTEVRNGSDLVPEATYVAKWDGSTWSALGSNGLASGGPLNDYVQGMTTDGTNLYVSGGFTDINNYGTVLSTADHVAKWDGMNWSALGDNGSGDGVFSSNTYPVRLQAHGSDLYMGGLFTDITNDGTVLTTADHVAKWDGTNWSALGSNGAGNGSLNQLVVGLGVWGDNLLVGGRFTNVNNNGTELPTADYFAAYGISFKPVYTISGNIEVSGVTLTYEESGSGISKSVTSDLNGNYFIPVPSGWTGVVTPSKTGYEFSPADRSYTNLSSNQNNQNYTATLVDFFTISGNAGIDAVTLSYFADGQRTVFSDEAGNYSLHVPIGWSGTITPFKPSYLFTPIDRNFSNVQADQPNQDFAAQLTYLISGNTGIGGVTLSYFDETPKTIVSDNLGNYSIQIPEYWSGTIIPSKLGYLFTPATRVYTNVSASLVNQNYGFNVAVSNLNNSGPGSLRQAIVNVPAGGTIKVDPSLSGQTILISSEISIDKNLTIDGSGLSSRLTIDGGGAVRIFVIGSSQTVTLQSLILKNGYGSGTNYGGAIFVSRYVTLRISESEFVSNSTESSGGAIYLQAPLNITVVKTHFRDNSAAQSGGALLLAEMGMAVFEDSVFENNSAWGRGGAIFSYNVPAVGLSLKNNLFSNNVSHSSGGAIAIDRFSSTFVTFENNTFYGNSAENAGGAIDSVAGISLFNNTFSHNHAVNGASLSVRITSSNKLFNNIFANSTSGSECYTPNLSGSLSIGNNNIVEDGSGPCMSIPGTIAIDPLLGPLADNGGLTPTLALLPGSPAIEAGDDTNCPDTDQRGVTRPQGAHCDIGAYEYVDPDLIPPQVTSIAWADSTPTAAATVDFDVTFSESVTGVDATDFALSATGVTGATVTQVSGSEDVYTVTVNTGSGSGTLRLDLLDDDMIKDESGNPLGGAGTGNGDFITGEVYDLEKTITLLSTASHDGWILESTENSGKGGKLNNAETILRVGDGPGNKQYRSILSFDTSTLPEGAVITSVTLKFKHAGVSGINPFTTHGKLLVDICDGAYKDLALQPADFNASCTSGKNKALSYTNTKVDNWYSQSLLADYFDLINPEGSTQFRLRFTKDDNNDFSADILKLFSGEAAEADRPQLIIEYYIQ